jgi:hypothetical protein
VTISASSPRLTIFRRARHRALIINPDGRTKVKGIPVARIAASAAACQTPVPTFLLPRVVLRQFEEVFHARSLRSLGRQFIKFHLAIASRPAGFKARRDLDISYVS